jgi:hypothetical protein
LARVTGNSRMSGFGFRILIATKNNINIWEESEVVIPTW